MLERLILPELGDAKIVTLTPAKVREWHAGLGDDHPTRNAHAYALLHAICATAVQDEVLDANPCRIRAAMQTKRRREVDILTPAEVDQLAAKMPAKLRASVLLAAWCGLRWGETSELRRERRQRRMRDAAGTSGGHLPGRRVSRRTAQDRGRSPRRRRAAAHPPNPQGAPEEPRRTRADSLLFPDDDGTHLRADLYRTHWEKARTAIGKPNLRVHDLRHVGAVLAAQSGATTAELMHRLGHTTPQMALRYQHVAEGRDAEIARRLSKLAAAAK